MLTPVSVRIANLIRTCSLETNQNKPSMLQRRVTRNTAKTAEGCSQPQPRPEIRHGKYSHSVFSEPGGRRRTFQQLFLVAKALPECERSQHFFRYRILEICSICSISSIQQGKQSPTYLSLHRMLSLHLSKLVLNVIDQL